MNSPVYLFDNILPQELLNKIQQYLPANDEVEKALKKYYDKLYDQKILDDENAYDKFVYPNCVCSNCPDNGRNKIFRRKECSVCFEYEVDEHNGEYASDEFRTVITNNPQYKKIAYGIICKNASGVCAGNDCYCFYEQMDDAFWYTEEHIWNES